MANIFAGLEKKNNVNGQTGNTANIFAGLKNRKRLTRGIDGNII